MARIDTALFVSPTAILPTTSMPIRTFPLTFPDTPVLSEAERPGDFRQLDLLGTVIFNLIRVGVFLAIVLWPWATAE